MLLLTPAPGANEPSAERSRAEVCCRASGAKAIALVGSFNDWDPRANPMTEQADGTWVAALSLPPGFYRYKFLVDGQWRCNPEFQKDGCGVCTACPNCIPNPYGTCDRVLIVT